MGRTAQPHLVCEVTHCEFSSCEEAGQTVFHPHFHIIPRSADDGKSLSFKPSETMLTAEEAAKHIGGSDLSAGNELLKQPPTPPATNQRQTTAKTTKLEHSQLRSDMFKGAAQNSCPRLGPFER
eukprot:1225714-Amphidinium_carterae.1